MEDGAASFEDYEAAVARFASCVEAAGFEVEGLRLVEDSQLFDYRIPIAAVDAGTDAECYERELRAIDISWQDSPVRIRGANELRGAAVILARCLDLNGIDYDLEVDERSDPAPVEAIVNAHGLTLEECGRQVAASLGP